MSEGSPKRVGTTPAIEGRVLSLLSKTIPFRNGLFLCPRVQGSIRSERRPTGGAADRKSAAVSKGGPEGAGTTPAIEGRVRPC